MKRFIGAMTFGIFLFFFGIAYAEVNIRLAHGEPEGQTYGVYASMFAKKLEQVSGGAMKCTIFANGVMGAELQAGQKVQQGTLQLALVTASNVGSLAKSANILSLPYLFDSPETLMGDKGYMREGSPFRAKISERILNESGKLRMLGVGTNGFRLLFTKDKPVTSLADLKGLKLRLPPSPVLQKTWNAWGASAYSIAWSETFSAIQQGVADAYESPLDTLLKSGFYPYTNRVTENLTYTPQCFFLLVNNDWFKKQSPENQEFLVKAAAENDVEHFAWVKTQQADVKKALLEKGVTFHQVTDAKDWEQRAVALWPELSELCGGKEWVDMVMKFRRTNSFE